MHSKSINDPPPQLQPPAQSHPNGLSHDQGLSFRTHKNHHHHLQMHKSRMKSAFSRVMLSALVAAAILSLSRQAFTHAQAQLTSGPSAQREPFPGVSRDLASLCAGRPSLPIDLASMVVHVKRNVSFNYKLYLFSGDHVLQTGQVIPRDDFRIHSFPVKLKALGEFWPPGVETFRYANSRLNSLMPAEPGDSFNLRQFLKPVPLYPAVAPGRAGRETLSRRSDDGPSGSPAGDLHGEALPGDPEFISHDVARVMEHRERQEAAESTRHHHNINSHIEFDRDDQVSVTKRVQSSSSASSTAAGDDSTSGSGGAPKSSSAGLVQDDASELMTPVGAFSSFHVNLTYLVRKDFGQTEPELVRLQVDAAQFVINQVVVISDGVRNSSHYPQNEDYGFLQHRLIRDPNTRITAINQIYEDWITRNFYTIVYVQRRLSQPDDEEVVDAGEAMTGDDDDTSNNNPAADRVRGFSRRVGAREQQQQVIVSDRLVFRGTSIALLGAEQLDYNVKAAAFITERNGLHYYLEFLTTGKFYLCAVDWTKRPFKMIDSRRFPIKATKTQLDNEELLLCPPAVCYSDRPVDEIVGYGRLNLNDNNNNNQVNHPARHNGTSPGAKPIEGSTNRGTASLASAASGGGAGPVVIDLRNVTGAGQAEDVERALKLAARHLETRLHLRDWVWTLPRQHSQAQVAVSRLAATGSPVAGGSHQPSGEESPRPSGTSSNRRHSNHSAHGTGFEWHYERAKRNDIKVKQDTYGYVLTGHEIDASYRVHNELYLISANHLITINYTLTNETVTSSQPLGEEFFGLSSTLIDPITGAFYDRHQSQVFFFKGDRYIGYNYTTKKPLDDFLLEAPLSSMELDPIGINLFSGGPLVSSLPVVGILGRQHEVDGVYHDLASDHVYIFSGMKFYKFLGSEFKNGTFRPVGQSLPPMQCINEHFLQGCHFDRAFPNPCTSEPEFELDHETRGGRLERPSQHKGGVHHTLEPDAGDLPDFENNHLEGSRFEVGPFKLEKTGDFYEQQQMKLRSIAARKPGFMNAILEHPALKAGEPGESAYRGMGQHQNSLGEHDQLASAHGANTKTDQQATIFVYLLITMVALTLLVTLLLIVVLIGWSRSKSGRPTGHLAHIGSLNPAFMASSHYLSNQQPSPETLSTDDVRHLTVSKTLSCIKVVNNNGDNKSVKSLDSNIIDNSVL